MKISYPVRDADGSEFRSVDEIMRLINDEAHGTWLLGANGLWHGGIHISDVSAPFSALNPDARSAGDPVPLQFMADGHIVAYRLNNDYLTAPCDGQTLRYSSSFVLVKSQCQPDPQKEKSWLEFYTLYMHLAPVNDYPVSPCHKVRDGHSGIRLRKYTPGQHGLPDGQESGDTGAYRAPPKTGKKLRAGDRVVSSRTGRFYAAQDELMTFGLVRLLTGETAGDEQYWVTLDPALMEPDGDMQMLMPAWMQKAKAKGTFNAVVKGGETAEWQVSAGTPAGFMGCTESPGEAGGQAECEWYVHLEVLSADPNMPAFLSNPEGVTGGKVTVRAAKGKTLYTRQTTPDTVTFTPTSATLSARCTLPQDATTPVTDASQRRWYNITGSGWLPQEDVEEAGQYDFLKQGFQPLKENSGGDMTDSPYEGWVPEAFGEISRAAEQGNEWYDQVPPFYRELMAEMDSNRDGKVTAEEIRQALVVRDPLVKEVVNRLVVRHHSEWYGGRATGRWEGFYAELEPAEIPYSEKWQADMEWMSQVPPFDKGEPVWHFHPVVFLDNLKKQNNTLIRGKLTYDAEGNNIPGSPYYSRVIHWPGNEASGVTLGRGYDMGGRTESEIYHDMISAGIDENKAQKISQASNYKGTAAKLFVTNNKNDIGEITEKQQIELFNIIYPDYISRTISNYKKWTAGFETAKDWDELDGPIQEVLIDFVYQGFTKGPKPMLAGANNDKHELISYIRNTPGISRYEPGRHRANYLEIN